MPYYFGEEDIGWPEDETDPPPKLEQFHYIAASDFTGKTAPVTFTVPDIDPSFGQERQSAAKRSFLDRLLGRNIQPVSQPAYSSEYFEKRQQQLVALMVPVLKDLGVKQLYCRYDGGNDEGFAWFDHAIMRSGETMAVDALARRLSETDLPRGAHEAGIVQQRGAFPNHARMAELLHHSLAEEWACKLLGSHYGTGPFSMYGAFTADLDDCTIIDDPNADPVVQNIEIAG